MKDIKEQLSGKDKAWLISTLYCAGDAIMTSDSNGNVDFVNAIAVEILGRPSSELIGKPVAEVFKIYHRVREQPIRFKKIKRNIGLPLQSFYISPAGEKKYLSARIAPLFADSGESIGHVIVFRDISRIIKAEELVKRERNNLRKIFQLLPTAMVIVDKEGKINVANAAFFKIFKLDHKNVTGETIGDAIGCVFSFEGGCNCSLNCAFCRIRKSMAAAVQEEQPVKEMSVPFKYVRAGIEHVIFLNTSIMVGTFEEKKEFIITIEDVTEAMYHEKSLKDARNMCMTTLDSLPMMIFKIDQNHDCDFINQTFRTYMNISKESFSEALKMHMKPSDYIRFQQTFNEAILNEEPFNIEVELASPERPHRIFRSMGRPYYEKNGEFGGIIGLFLDIHDERCAEELFRKSQQKYFALFQNMDNSITYFKAIFDEKGSVVDAQLVEMNQATEKIFGVTREMSISQSISGMKFLGTEEAKMIIQYFDKAISKGKTINVGEYYSERLKRWVEASICSPEPGYVAALTWNIDAKKQTEIELKSAMERSEEANRSKSEFLANTSHEIRTPLNGIVGMIDLTMLEPLSKEQQENLETAKGCVHALLDIINDILDFAKIEAGKLMIDPVGFNLVETIEATIKMHRKHAMERGLKLAVHYENLPETFVIGDGRRLKQVLNNLLSNAIKFTDEGSVELTVNQEIILEKPDQLMLHIDVKDTGIGIEPSKYSKLFKSFTQIDGSHTRKYGGTGIGLVITKQLTEMMGGRVGFISEIGCGSTFSVHIPVTISNQSLENCQESLPDILFKGNRILLVEDDRVNQMVVSRMLESFGIAVDIAENGEAGVIFAGRNRYDLILMDIQMPVMDGIMATQIIRGKIAFKSATLEHDDVNLSANRETPIIALSAYALKGDEAIFRASGMDSYLSKPVDRHQMQVFLNEYLGKNNTPELVMIRDRMERYQLTMDKNLHQESSVAIDGKTKIEINHKLKKLKTFALDRNFAMMEIVAHQLKQLFEEINVDGLKNLVFKLELDIRKDELESIPDHLKRIEELWLMMEQDKSLGGIRNEENSNCRR
jgi:PAS domain S-box-containing protein